MTFARSSIMTKKVSYINEIMTLLIRDAKYESVTEYNKQVIEGYADNRAYVGTM